MQINDSTSLITTLSAPRLRSVLSAWQTGQILNAVVTRVDNVGSATLNVNNVPIEIRTPQPLTAGMRLLLEVVTPGPQPVLKFIVLPPSPSSLASPSEPATLATRPPNQIPTASASTPMTTTPASTTTLSAASATQTSPPPRAVLLPQSTPLTTPSNVASKTSTTLPSVAINMPTDVAPASPSTATASTEAILQAVRRALPRQSALVPLLANLRALASGDAQQQPTVPQAVRALAQQIFRNIVDAKQATTPEGLQQAVRDSGVVLENKLATLSTEGSATLLEGDLKAGLTRLAALLQTLAPTALASAKPEPMSSPDAPPHLRGITVTPQATPAPSLAATTSTDAALVQLAQQTDGALERITLHQLATLAPATPDTPQWTLELPIRHGEFVNVFHFQFFERKESKNPGAPPAWFIRLAFDLVTLGPVRALITLLGGGVSASFWAERAETVALFNTHLNELRRLLSESGLNVGPLHCDAGNAPFPEMPLTPQRNTRLVDERA